MKRIYTLSIILLLSLATSFAQNKTSYFVNGSTLSHEMNPAFTPKVGYVGFPFLSNIYVGSFGNIGTSTLFYPLENGKLGLFMHPEVSSEEFLDKLSPMNYLGADVKYDIMNAGWYAKNGDFWTLSLGAKTDASSNLPFEFFQMMKDGMADNPQTYHIENLSLGVKAASELSLGYSTDFNNAVRGLRFGARLKLWVGFADMNLSIDDLDVYAGSDKWTAKSISSGHIYGGMFKYTNDEDGYIDDISFDFKNFNVAGVGGGLDLGLSYTISEGTPVDGMRFSVSVADLGFMQYFKNNATMLAADGNMNFQGIDSIDDPETNIREELQGVKEDILQMASFKASPAEKGMTEFFGATVYGGIDYTFCRDQMNFGVLYTGRFNNLRNLHEITVSYNYSPAEWFNIAVSYSMMNIRSSIGALISFIPRKGLNFFIGSDYISFKYTPQGMPVDHSFTNINMGISIPLVQNDPER